MTSLITANDIDPNEDENKHPGDNEKVTGELTIEMPVTAPSENAGQVEEYPREHHQAAETSFRDSSNPWFRSRIKRMIALDLAW
jgi:hypothetical protein